MANPHRETLSVYRLIVTKSQAQFSIRIIRCIRNLLAIAGMLFLLSPIYLDKFVQIYLNAYVIPMT
ncbi:MAG: lysis protein [Leviviridae sp.]|nr:MAG: lysis protein [Leviviridae sp.]